MTDLLSKRQAWLLALVVCLAIGLFGYGLFSIGSQQQLWHGSYHLTMQVGNAAGLEVGTRVRIQGVQAGQVVAIEPPAQRGGFLLVKLRLDGQSRTLLGTDARAEVKAEGLLGGKVIDIAPGSPGAELLAEGSIIPGTVDSLNDDLKKLASESQATLSDLRNLAGNLQKLSERGEKAVREVEGLASDLREGKGALGSEVVGTLRQVKDASQSMQQGFDAMKHLPLVGKHVDPHTKVLVRPGMDKVVAIFAETEIFHEGRSVFHPEGVEKLRQWAATHVPGSKFAGTEFVIVAYSDPNTIDGKAAEILTQEQADAVKTYLCDHHSIHKISAWRSRSVQAIGMGTRASPGIPASPPLPLRRIEVILFAPAGTLS
jgi:phospholipid/cholesterol/gamma-HCH transport system substrate-binding protein